MLVGVCCVWRLVVRQLVCGFQLLWQWVVYLEWVGSWRVVVVRIVVRVGGVFVVQQLVLGFVGLVLVRGRRWVWWCVVWR